MDKSYQWGKSYQWDRSHLLAQRQMTPSTPPLIVQSSARTAGWALWPLQSTLTSLSAVVFGVIFGAYHSAYIVSCSCRRVFVNYAQVGGFQSPDPLVQTGLCNINSTLDKCVIFTRATLWQHPSCATWRVTLCHAFGTLHVPRSGTN